MKFLEEIKKFQNNGSFYTVSENDKTYSMTYEQLISYSDKLTSYILENFKDKNTPVAVYGHKNPYMLVCFLACVKSGRAYCPIDINVPETRTERILQKVKPELILTVEKFNTNIGKTLTLSEIEKICTEDITKRVSDEHYVKSEDVFYIIFTSGSTGDPKGVQITYENLNNFIAWGLSLIGNESGKTFINQAPFSFDLSVMDLYLAMASGGKIYSLSKDVQKNYSELFSSLEKSNANIWVSTPSFADTCLADKKFSEKLLPNLNYFLFCGETLTNSTAEKLLERFSKAQIYNTYGPTESTVAISSVLVDRELIEKYNPLPIGIAKPGTEIEVVNENGISLKEEEKGEIIIYGDTVSKGYFLNEELNKKFFFEKEINGKKVRAYRTGDKGYFKDKMLFYNGRIDLQVKLHGYRIEIEDVENNLMKVAGIKKVAVVPKVKNDKVDSLTAFVIYEEEVVDRFATVQKIKKEMKEFVPEYMVPKKIVFLDEIPMTVNGKANRRKLLELI